jgi:NAD(P)-dependent dehydrogenase (short-subunit alcohol dehydrogenase family)
MDTLRGRVALVTGGSRTLGAEIARRLAGHGVDVAVNYQRAADAAQAVCGELVGLGVRAVPIQADVSEPDDVARLVAATEAELGPIDILVNNVGPYVDTPFLTMPVGDFDRILAGNVRATFLLTQAAGAGMKARPRGHIINIAATDFRHRSHSVYGLAKQGVLHLTEAMALELAPEVRLNALAPDLIADNEEMTDETVRSAVAGTPLQRLVTRREIADLVCLMCTDAFDMVTGATIVMDGGRSVPRINLG